MTQGSGYLLPIPHMGRGGKSQRKRQDPEIPVLFQHLSTVPQARPPSKANHHANKKGMVKQKRYIKALQ